MSRILLLLLLFLTGNLTAWAQTQWADKSLVVTQDLQACHFSDPHNGFVAGDSSTFYRTTNAGDSWEAVNVPGLINFRQIDFVDDQTGFAAGGEGIMKTRDGGVTWQELQVAEGAASYDFVTETLWYGVSMDFPDAVVKKTTDGGQSWTREVNEGWISSDPYTYAASYDRYECVMYMPEQDRVYVGGSHYHYSPNYAGEYVPEIYYFSGDLGNRNTVASIGESISFYNASFTKLVSLEGSRIYGMQNQRNKSYPAPSHNYYGVRASVNRSAFQALSGSGLGEGDYLFDLEVVSPEVLYLANYSSENYLSTGIGVEILLSTDGGTWFEAMEFPGESAIHDIEFPSRSVGYFVGRWGKIFRYGDPDAPEVTPPPPTTDDHKVAPNPFQEVLYLNLGEFDRTGQYNLYSTDGRLVATGTFNEVRQVKIDTDLLPKGLYILEADLQGGLKGDLRRYKVLKQ